MKDHLNSTQKQGRVSGGHPTADSQRQFMKFTCEGATGEGSVTPGKGRHPWEEETCPIPGPASQDVPKPGTQVPERVRRHTVM